MKTLFETAELCILDKPALTLTVPSRMGRGDPRPCLGIALQETLQRPVYPVHRLDFEVSGLVVFAKTPETHRILNRWFEQHRVKKEYEARTAGAPPLALGLQTWTSKLVRGKKRTFEAPYGQEALTHAQCLGLDDSRHLRWRLWPQTGRPHQLRVELAKRGFPILGDRLYGSTEDWPPGGIALRALALDFKDCPEATSLGLPEQLRLEGFEKLAPGQGFEPR